MLLLIHAHDLVMHFLHDVYEMNTQGRSCLSAWFNLRIAGRILMKLGIAVVPLEATLKSYLLISYKQ
jgi:hypothetical protein